MTHQRGGSLHRNGPAPETRPAETDQLTEMAERATQIAQDYLAPAQDAIRNFKPFMEKSMKQNPIGTLAGAAVVAFLLGVLWRK
jgi:ElaB/YqjD/DUF883 family membrane-anchored ribosome-binding protein